MNRPPGFRPPGLGIELPPGVRLPESPIAPSAQGETPFQAQAPAPLDGVSEDFESNSKDIPFFLGGPGSAISFNGTTAGMELALETERLWRNCDVRLEPLNPENLVAEVGPTYLSAILCALDSSGNVIEVISTGRMGPYGALPTMPGSVAPNGTGRSRWVCAGRLASPVKWRVYVHVARSTLAPLPVCPIRVSLIASPHATFVPPFLGAIAMGIGGNVMAGPALTTFSALNFNEPPYIEWLGVQAVNDQAAARYLHLHDRLGAGVGGLAPAFVWPMGSVAGDGVFDFTFRYRARNVGFLVISTTPAVTTQPIGPDGALQAYIR